MAAQSAADALLAPVRSVTALFGENSSSSPGKSSPSLGGLIVLAGKKRRGGPIKAMTFEMRRSRLAT
eukprot:9476294-Pyramimonas_sp.AAC.2